MSTIIEVHAGWQGLQPLQKVGELHCVRARGNEIFSFTYDTQWLACNLFQIDPNLQLYGGQQFLSNKTQTNFGIFLDSSPDRWGRTLMQRREAMLARQEARPQRRLMEMDYFLGVHDEQRSGALRFKLPGNGPFLSADGDLASPPWVQLRELEKASWQVQGDEIENQSYSQWLNMLLAPGSSLGGARPKAGVRATNNSLWIAKFPSRNDFSDMAAWEMLAYQLASKAGVNMSQCRLVELTEKRRAFLTERFDRHIVAGRRQRIHFASAMTLLGYSDGADCNAGVSYLEIADFLGRYGSDTAADLAELWRRILFSVCVSNTDDHLRNHGFLWQEDGWKLSPAYDINPDPSPGGLSLNISETDNSLDIELVQEVAPYFRITPKRANSIIKEVIASVTTWRNVAASLNISRSEQERLEPAFSACVE